MSTTKVAPESKIFHNIISKYYEARSSSDGRGGAGFVSLTNSVRSGTRKVRVCASDFVADVELAANRALRDYPAERQLFKRIYLDADEAFKTVFSKRMNAEAFDLLIKEIERRVGVEFESAGIYPIEKYTEAVVAQ